MSFGIFRHFGFSGGVHARPDSKKLAASEAVKTAELLDKYTLYLSQNAGKPPKLVVKTGDEVKKGQLIAEADGFVSANLHAPTSGKVGAVLAIPGATGALVPAVEILSDGRDEWCELPPPLDWRAAAPAELLERVKLCGIVGMGGAAFPSHVKLSPPPEKKVDTLIVNGAECEPYLAADHRLMLEHPEKVLTGSAICGRILGVDRIFLGVESNKKDAIAALEDKAAGYKIRVIKLPARYPQGAEKQLIYSITGRKVPSGALPMDARCVVQNVGSIAAMADAVLEGRPLIERITTVSGEAVAHPGNFLVRIGTPVAKLIEWAGGERCPTGKVILGGPMMGFALHSPAVTLSKNSSGVVLLPRKNLGQYSSSGCLRCGKCVRVCPMNLVPSVIACAAESGKYELARQNGLFDCVECGVCAYVCPAGRPLIQHIRRAKSELRKNKGK